MRPAIQAKKQKSLRLRKSLCCSTTDTSKPIRDSEGRIGRGPDIHVRVCTFEDACAAAV